MQRESGAGTPASFTRKAASGTRRTASLAEVLEAVARESKVTIVPLEKERTAPGASATPQLLQQPPSTSKSKNDSTAKSGLALRTDTSTSVSILLLFTISVVTAGFVISALTTGRYISTGGAFGSGRGGHSSSRNAVPSRNLLKPDIAPAVASGGTAEELEGEKMARRYMIQPSDPASSERGVVESGPATEPFRDIDNSGAKVPAATGRRTQARTSSWQVSEPKTVDGVQPTTTNYADHLERSEPNRTRAPVVSD
ncbi:hypothetical protein V5799_023069 [Amblyomma americanum]|uniref:Uncharacterized protein n=1 Tax=Amblyomma americanum TaxID=6943 RepID=A0AAQ4EGZ3_AMBAM